MSNLLIRKAILSYVKTKILGSVKQLSGKSIIFAAQIKKYQAMKEMYTADKNRYDNGMEYERFLNNKLIML